VGRRKSYSRLILILHSIGAGSDRDGLYRVMRFKRRFEGQKSAVRISGPFNIRFILDTTNSSPWPLILVNDITHRVISILIQKISCLNCFTES
jgi:hypothetical protein